MQYFNVGFNLYQAARMIHQRIGKNFVLGIFRSFIMNLFYFQKQLILVQNYRICFAM